MAAKTLTIDGKPITAEEGATVLQVAEEAGFANQFHFSRVFKSVFGIPPRTIIKMR